MPNVNRKSGVTLRGLDLNFPLTPAEGKTFQIIYSRREGGRASPPETSSPDVSPRPPSDTEGRGPDVEAPAAGFDSGHVLLSPFSGFAASPRSPHDREKGGGAVRRDGRALPRRRTRKNVRLRDPLRPLNASGKVDFQIPISRAGRPGRDPREPGGAIPDRPPSGARSSAWIRRTCFIAGTGPEGDCTHHVKEPTRYNLQVNAKRAVRRAILRGGGASRAVGAPGRVLPTQEIERLPKDGSGLREIYLQPEPLAEDAGSPGTRRPYTSTTSALMTDSWLTATGSSRRAACRGARVLPGRAVAVVGHQKARYERRSAAIRHEAPEGSQAPGYGLAEKFEGPSVIRRHSRRVSRNRREERGRRGDRRHLRAMWTFG